jgi:ferrous iron transport protein A
MGAWKAMQLRLDTLAIGANAIIVRLDSAILGDAAVRRLRSIGLSEGTMVEPLHRGVLLGRDPLAVRAGRMTLAVRKAQAAGIEVELVEAASA